MERQEGGDWNRAQMFTPCTFLVQCWALQQLRLKLRYRTVSSQLQAGTVSPSHSQPSLKPARLSSHISGAWGLRGRWITKYLLISSSSSRSVPSWGWPVRPGHRKYSHRGLPSLAPRQFHLPNSDIWKEIEKSRLSVNQWAQVQDHPGWQRMSLLSLMQLYSIAVTILSIL